MPLPCFAVMVTPFHLLALTEASAYVVYALMGLYAALVLYAALGGWPRSGDRQKIGLSWFMALPWAAFFGLWLAGCAVWGLLLWLQFGDAGPNYAPWTSGIVAITASTILLVRLATGWRLAATCD